MTRSMCVIPVVVFLSLLSCASDWEAFESQDGGFSASFPLEPSRHSVEIDTVFGPATLTVFAADADVNAFFVSYYEIPAKLHLSPAAILDAERDRGLDNTKSSLVSDEPFVAAGFSGRALMATHPSGNRIRIRNLLIGNRLYSLMVATSPDAASNDVATRFFESFVVLGD